MDRFQQISRLEAEIGIQILRRSSRSVEPRNAFVCTEMTAVRALAKAFLAMALDRAERLNGAVPVEIAA